MDWARAELLWAYLVFHLCVGLVLPFSIGLIPLPLLRRIMRDGKDDHTLIRRTIETSTTRLVRFLIAPGFWFLIAGLAGLAAWTSVAVLHAYRPARVIERLMGAIPAFLTALLLCVSAIFVSNSSLWRGLVTLFAQGKIYLGWPVAATAGALGVTLGGPPWIGPKDSSARLTARDMDRAAMLQYVFYLVLLGSYSAVMLAHFL